MTDILALARTRLEESGESGFDPSLLLVVTWVGTVPREQYDPATEAVSQCTKLVGTEISLWVSFGNIILILMKTFNYVMRLFFKSKKMKKAFYYRQTRSNC